ncbi:coproporphyrinogen III oxidase [Brevundimonas sp. AAP58]|uniref:radical SAM family heme chaperone HemW n=1 Tax=Brevundimonas sp. AAP58 TaxID=1523422 RepID=UPI0006B928A6|nr:radical SAM family heme chaperone HemW [Brevundimonas sp. AAP58]KPF77668.1 coproporphyrinogen III oxidase [Brevundimonas sp. AAP58]
MTDDRPNGVAVYVHWPYCARICPYCDFNVVKDRGWREEQAALVQAILTDLESQAAQSSVRPLASIFFGGGTPSLMRPEDVAAVVATARRLFPLAEPVEITLEANPTDAEAGHFAALAGAGVNRVSLGVQSLDDGDLAFLGRNHSAAEARRAIAVAGDVFERLSIDLIYALPGQTVDQWRAAITEAVALGFEHVSPYQLTLEPMTAFGRAFARGALIPPCEDTAADLYEATQATLKAAGFEAYEVSNHARSEAAQSVHNLHVWRGGDYIGVGPGAHGRVTVGGARTATVAHRRIADYVAGVASGATWSESATLDRREAAEERLLLGLRTSEGVPLSLLGPLGLDPATWPLKGLFEEGFVTVAGGRLAATAKGRPVLDAVLKALLT